MTIEYLDFDELIEIQDVADLDWEFPDFDQSAL